MEEAPPLLTAHLKTVADLPSALIDDVCFGVAELPDIFEKYGYTPESAEVFRENAMFKRVVSIRAAELEKEGITHRVRASMVADAALGALAKRVTDPNTATGVLLDTYKAIAKNAGLEPKGAEVQAGVGFSISINIAPPSTTPQRATIDVADVEEEPRRVALNPAEFEI